MSLKGVAVQDKQADNREKVHCCLGCGKKELSFLRIEARRIGFKCKTCDKEFFVADDGFGYLQKRAVILKAMYP